MDLKYDDSSGDLRFSNYKFAIFDHYHIWTSDRTYEVVVSSRHFPYLKQHVVQNVPLMPAAGYLEVLIQACQIFSPKIQGPQQEPRLARSPFARWLILQLFHDDVIDTNLYL